MKTSFSNFRLPIGTQLALELQAREQRRARRRGAAGGGTAGPKTRADEPDEPEVMGHQLPDGQPRPAPRKPGAKGGFSLIEIMITVGLLTFIILGLLAMFNQTQRVFRSSMTQSDVLESGRSVFGLISRELEQMTPTRTPQMMNFMADVSPPTRLNGPYPTTFVPAAVAQDLPGAGQQRMNLCYQLFFLTRENRNWTGIGYLVDNPGSGVGTLYRWQVTTNSSVGTLASIFDHAAYLLYSQNFVTNTLTRVADGVVDLRVKAYGPTGYLLTNYVNSAVIRTNFSLPPVVQNTDLEYYFANNAVPAALDLEIGFLEDRTLARLKSIPDPAARADYLKTHSPQVHLFRQRIPVRNVDPTVYP